MIPFDRIQGGYDSSMSSNETIVQPISYDLYYLSKGILNVPTIAVRIPEAFITRNSFSAFFAVKDVLTLQHAYGLPEFERSFEQPGWGYGQALHKTLFTDSIGQRYVELHICISFTTKTITCFACKGVGRNLRNYRYDCELCGQKGFVYETTYADLLPIIASCCILFSSLEQSIDDTSTVAEINTQSLRIFMAMQSDSSFLMTGRFSYPLIQWLIGNSTCRIAKSNFAFVKHAMDQFAKSIGLVRPNSTENTMVFSIGEEECPYMTLLCPGPPEMRGKIKGRLFRDHERGQSFSAENVFSGQQLLTLLAGLAALNGQARLC